MFEDKTAIVTGAAKGIGYGIALALAKEKAAVILADLDEGANYSSAVEIEKSTGSRTFAVKCDVSKKEDVDDLINTAVEKFGGLDILVNNAGIFPFKPFLEMTEADWDRVLDVNLKSAFLLSQAAAKTMPAGGKIVNISSIASLVGFEGLTHYCASKGGMNGMIRAMALELAPKKINVNAVAPGAIQTPGAGGAISGEILKLIPWQRVGQPEDIANAAVFLLSDASGFITGASLVVDGGLIVNLQ